MLRDCITVDERRRYYRLGDRCGPSRFERSSRCSRTAAGFSAGSEEVIGSFIIVRSQDA
jgi:hypothetical protein